MAEQGGRFFETIFWNCNENYIRESNRSWMMASDGSGAGTDS